MKIIGVFCYGYILILFNFRPLFLGKYAHYSSSVVVIMQVLPLFRHALVFFGLWFNMAR